MKKNKKVLSAILLSFLFMFTITSVAFALTTVGPTTTSEVQTLLDKIISWIQGIVLSIGVLMIIWAGFTWMTAGGEEDKLKNARQRLIWGLVGIAVALFAGAAKGFITSLLT